MFSHTNKAPRVRAGIAASISLMFLTGLLLTACTSSSVLLYGYGDPLAGLRPLIEALRVASALAGLVLLIVGWKIYRFMVALPGFVIGAVLGAALLAMTEQSSSMAIVGLLVGGLLGAALALVLRDVAIFLVGGVLGAIVAGSVWGILADTFPSASVLLVGGVIGGIVLLALARLWIIALSSSIGAVMLGVGMNLGVGWMVLFCVLGIAVQTGLGKAMGEAVLPGKNGKGREQHIPEPEVPIHEGEEYVVPPRQAPTAALISRDGRRISIEDGFLIGRGSACDLHLPDRFVSRRHATIRYARGRYYLQDQGSLHGTYVNGQRIDAVALNPGDRIIIGGTEFDFRLR